MTLAVVLIATLAACGPDGRSQEGVAEVSPETRARAGGSDHLDPLTIGLEFADSTVTSGGELDATLLIANETSETIVDPSCQIGAASYALVPADQPDAEAWLAPTVDCDGPRAMPAGYTSERARVTYFARTRLGDPLPPGAYLAVLDITGRTSRLLYPITITE